MFLRACSSLFFFLFPSCLLTSGRDTAHLFARFFFPLSICASCSFSTDTRHLLPYVCSGSVRSSVFSAVYIWADPSLIFCYLFSHIAPTSIHSYHSSFLFGRVVTTGVRALGAALRLPAPIVLLASHPFTLWDARFHLAFFLSGNSHTTSFLVSHSYLLTMVADGNVPTSLASCTPATHW